MQSVARTLPYQNYYPPSKDIVKETANRLGFNGAYSYELVRDIANSMSFPKDEFDNCFTEPSEWIITSNERDLGKQQQEISSTFAYHRKVQDFVKKIDAEGFSGNSPLEKAINIVAALSSQRGGTPGRSNVDEAGEPPIPIFQETVHMESLCKGLKETVERLDKLQPGSYTAKALGVDGGEGVLGGIKAASMGFEHNEILRKIGIFNANGKIAAHKKVKIEDAPYSKVKRVLQMTNYMEIGKISPIQHILPTFNYKFATKQFQVEKGVNVEEAKQCLILLIDDSGSMRSSKKVSWIKALLLNRCEEVVKGNAELYICTFEAELDRDWIVVKTPEEAKKVWEKFTSYFRLSRGTTNLQKAIESATKIIKSGKVPTKSGEIEITSKNPQLVIINDGEDDVKSTFLPTIETHGFLLQGKHGIMQKFCTRSGGTYTEFWD